jgi:hypothetical protein
MGEGGPVTGDCTVGELLYNSVEAFISNDLLWTFI